MSDVIPVTYATIELRTERLGELQQCLMAHEFFLVPVQDGTCERWAIRDARQADEPSAV